MRFRDFLLIEKTEPDVEHSIIGMYRDNRNSISEIASVTGASIGTIYRVLEKFGLKPTRKNQSSLSPYMAMED